MTSMPSASEAGAGRHPSSMDAAFRLLLPTYARVLDGAPAAYCSAPITSGRRFLDWLDRIGQGFTNFDAAGAAYRASHSRHVIEPNRAHARQVVQRLRRTWPHAIIDPTTLSPYRPGWTQHDWHAFWQAVIERFAEAAFFVDGWPYSHGAAFEFWIAHRKGIPTYDEHQRPLSRTAGIALLTDAIAEMKQRGADTAFLEEVLQDVQRLPRVPRARHP